MNTATFIADAHANAGDGAPAVIAVGRTIAVTDRRGMRFTNIAVTAMVRDDRGRFRTVFAEFVDETRRADAPAFTEWTFEYR